MAARDAGRSEWRAVQQCLKNRSSDRPACAGRLVYHVRLVSLARMRASTSMHILMIAPEPFFEPRGTPFSEFHRIRAVTTLGHTVDLVTYPFGQSVSMAGL